MAQIIVKQKKSRWAKAKETIKKFLGQNKKEIFYIIMGLVWFTTLLFWYRRILFILMSGVFLAGIYSIVTQVVSFVRGLEIDWENDEIHQHRMTRRKWTKYKKTDGDGKTATAKYKPQTDDGEIVLLDKVNKEEDHVVINPTANALSWANKYKQRAVRLSRWCVKQRNTIIRLSTERELEAAERAYNVYRENPVIKKFFGTGEQTEQITQEEKADEEMQINLEKEQLQEFIELAKEKNEQEGEKEEKSEVKA